MDKSNAKPLRSLLFTPGDQEARIAENAKSGADALFLDLEEPRTPCPESTRVRARGLVARVPRRTRRQDRRPRVFRASAAGRVRHDPARPPSGDGPQAHRHSPAQDHRPGRRTRGRRDPRLPRNRARPARRADAALPDPRERRVRSATRTRSRWHRRASPTWAARSRASATSRATSDSAGRRAGPRRLYIREKVLIDARAAGIRYPISGMWGGANDDHDGLARVAHRAPRHRLLRDDARQPEHVDDGERRVHADAPKKSPTGRTSTGWRPRPNATNEQVIYGDTNQGEGHEIHIAHVATARKLLGWAQELGVA